MPTNAAVETAPAVTLAESDVTLVKSASAALRRFLEADPKAEERLMEFLSRRLDGEVDIRTWGTVYSGLTTLLGEDAATMFAWAANAEPNPVDEIDKLVDPDLGLFIRHVLANFGPELRHAYERGTELAHNWRYVSRDVFFDIIKGRPYIRFTIEQFNDDEVVLEGTGDNMMALTRQLLITLRMVGAADSFSSDAIDAFVQEADSLKAMLRETATNGAAAVVAPEGAAVAPGPSDDVVHEGPSPAAA